MADGEQAQRMEFDDLERIVAERLEETIRLEFKRELPESGKNADLAKAIASMTNTEGGIIIYGIEEDAEGRAGALRPFSIGKSAERVTLVANSSIDEPMPLQEVYAVQDRDNPEKGYLIVVVPKSDRAPHLVEGMAWGRTAKGAIPLARRQLGEAFARSPGFAHEFGLVTGMPGRIRVSAMREAYQDSGMGGASVTRYNFYLQFENDGDAPVYDATWEWSPNGSQGQQPHVNDDPFPLEVVEPGVGIRVNLFVSISGSRSQNVRTKWRDAAGNQHQKQWPVTW